MSRCKLRLLAPLWAALLWSPYALGQQSDCFERATTNQEMERCGKAIILPLEEKVSAEFVRLNQKFGANEEMPEMLRLTKDNWNGCRNVQCMLEGVASVGGRTEKRRSIEAQRAFMQCVTRTLNEMHAAISKL